MSKNNRDFRTPRAAAAVLASGIVAWSGLAGGARADDAAPGATVFAGRCAVCHGAEAAGIPGTFPSLRAQISAFGRTPEGRDYLVMVITTGLMGEIKLGGITYRGVMPAQSGLTETEVAAVLSYLAGNRGQDPSPAALVADDVVAARARHAERTAQATRALRPAYPET